MMSHEDPQPSYAEVTVYGYQDPKTQIDVLQNARSPKFLEQIKSEGAGQATLALSDPKLADNPDLLDYRNIVKLSCDGEVRSAFIIQNHTDNLVGSGEQSEKAITFSGNGLRQWLADATVYPEGGMKQSSPDTRIFSWASQRGSWYNASDWTTPVKIEKYHIAPDGTADLQYTYNPAEWPDAPNAYWVWSRAFTYETSSGKRLAVTPEGTTYFRYEFTVTDANAGSYSLFAAADDSYTAFIDSSLAIDGTQPAGTTHYHETVRYDFELEAGKHVLAFRVDNRKRQASTVRNPSALIAALFQAGDADEGTAARLVTTTGGSGWVCMGYPAKEPGWSVGEILLTLLAEAKSRGVKFPNWVSPNFTADADSNGVAWTDNLPFEFNVGDTYLDVIKQMEELAVDVWIDPDTYALNVVQTRGTDRSVVANGRDAVIFEEGKNLFSASVDGEADLTNSLVMKTDDGWLVSQPSDSTSQDRYGRLEGTLSTSVNNALSKKLSDKVFAQKALPDQAAAYSIFPTTGSQPFEDFVIGDYVMAPDAKEVSTKRRVSSIAITVDDAGNPAYAVEFDTIFQTKEEEYDRMAKLASGSGLGSGFVSANGAGSGGTSPSVGSGTGYTPGNPLPPSNITVSSSGYFTPQGTARARAVVQWDPVSLDVNGSPVKGISKYEVYARYDSTQSYQLLGSVSGSTTQLIVQNLAADDDVYFVMNASVDSTRTSSFSDPPVLHHTAKPVVVMMPPTAPKLTSKLGTVTATWDGKLTTGTPPAQFRYVYAESQTGTGGWTRAGTTLSASGDIIIANLPVGSSVSVRLVAVDSTGVTSAVSATTTTTVTGVDTTDLGQEFEDSYQALKDQAQAAQEAAQDAQNTADAALAATTNAVKDPSFEADPSPWTPLPSSRFSIVSTQAHSGSKSLQVTSGSSATSLVVGTVGPVQAGQVYRFRAWRKVSSDYNGTASNGKLRVGGFAAGSSSSTVINSVPWGGASDWTLAEYIYTVPSNVPYPSVEMTLSFDHTAGTVWVDDVDIRDITDVKAALDAAVQAGNTAQTAATQAGQALDSANGKNKNWYLPEKPAGSTFTVGDQWWDTDNDFAVSRWDGSDWVPTLLGNAAFSGIDAGKISTGFLDAGRIQSATITSRMLAVGDLKDYFDGSDFENQATIPWLTMPDQYSVLDTSLAHAGAQSMRMLPPAQAFTPKTTRNLSTNPKVSNNLDGWQAFSAGSGYSLNRGTANDPLIYQTLTSYIRLTFGSGASNSGGARFQQPVTAGKTYSVSVGVRSTQSGYQSQFRIIWQTSATGSEVGNRYYSDPVTHDGTTTWSQISRENMTAPAGATVMMIDTYGPNGPTPNQGQNLYLTGLMVNEGSLVLPYFDGDVPGVPGSDDFSWEGTAGNSTSKRVQSSQTSTQTNWVINPRYANSDLSGNGTGAYSNLGGDSSSTAHAYQVTGVASPTGSTGGTAARVRAYASLTYMDGRVVVPGITPGQTYSAGAAVRMQNVPNVQTVRLYIQWFNGSPQAGGSVISTVSQTFSGRYTGYRRLSITGRAAPANTTHAVFIIRVVDGTIPNQAYMDFGAVVMTEGSEVPDYFDGSFANTDAQTYTWNASAETSPSILTQVADRDSAKYTLNTDVPVKAGQSFYINGYAYRTDDYNGNVEGSYIALTNPADGSIVGRAPMGTQAITTTQDWQQFGATIPIPDGVTTVRPVLSTNHSAGLLYLDDLQMKVSGVTLIQDGSITTDKLAAGSVTTNILAAGAVTAGILAANAVTTNTLAANAITSKHTITGATIQTATSGARTVMNSSGLQVLDSSGSPLVRLGYNQSTGMSIADPNNGNLIPLANLSFGTKYMPTSGGTASFAVPVASSDNAWGGYSTEVQGTWVAPSNRVMWLFFALTDQASQQNFRVEAQAYLVDSTDTSVGARVTLTNGVNITWTSGFFMGVKAVVTGRQYELRNSYRAYRNYSAPASPPAYVISRLNILMPV